MFEVRYLRLPIARRVNLLALAAWFFGTFSLFAQSPNPDADMQPPPIPPEEVPTPTPVLAPAPQPHHTDNVGAIPVAPAMTPVASPARKAIEPLVVVGHPSGVTSNYGREGNQRAAKLRSYAPQNYNFDRASLRDVLRLLADEAGLPYIGIPEHSPKAQRLVTFKMTAPPFTALESLARQNDVQLDYEDGVWFMRVHDANAARAYSVENTNELIGVIYQLKFDPVDRIDFRDQAAGGVPVGAGGTGTGVAGGAAQVTTPNMPLQYSQRVFQARAPRVVNEIRSMLGMRPLQYNPDGTVIDPEAEGQAVHNAQRTPLLPADGEGNPLSGGGGAGGAGQAGASGVPGAVAAAAGGGLLPVYVPPQRPQVIYNSDNNLLWVVATRKQHKWVAEYLTRVDKPQDLIAIEVKFFETRKNPQTDFGINWENTFGTGITVSGGARVGAGTAEAPGEIGSVTYNKRTGTESVLGTQFPVDQENRGLSLNAPYAAVLSLDQVSATLQAFVRDRDSSLVQYPRVLTINNREVAITAAENTPVNAGVSQTQSGSTATQTGTLGYLPTGTQINILPKSVGNGQIALTVAITISQIVRFEMINLGTGQNPYPVTTQRVYNAALQVDSGYTLAVGGLEKTADTKNNGGIPVLKDIPGVGYLFKNKNRSRDRSNLIIFITPFLIADPSRTPGISEHPEAVIPLRPGVPPPAPNFTPDGELLGGDAAMAPALDWLQFQLDYFNQTHTEGRDDNRSMSELRSVISRARLLSELLQNQIAAGKGYASEVLVDSSERADSLLLDLNKVLAKAQLGQFQIKQGFP